MMYGLQVVCIDCGGPVEPGKNRCAMHLRRTPDRAVVDDYEIESIPGGTMINGWCQECGGAFIPRATSALSEDGQWLAVLETIDQATGFTIYDFHPEFYNSWRFKGTVEDTGQDAHEVLAQFLMSKED